MSYADLATALDVTVPAVKSLLVRARLGLVEAAEARTTDCAVIREDLVAAYDRGVKASGRARRHMKECPGCREYRSALRGVRSSFAALSPSAGAAALTAKLFGIGGGGAAAGGAAAGGGGAAATGAAAVGGATACKVAAVVCAAALTAGGTVEVNKIIHPAPPAKQRAEAAHAVTHPTLLQRRAAFSSAAAAAPAPLSAPVAEKHRARHTGEAKPSGHLDAALAPPSIPVYTPAGGADGSNGGTVDTVSGGVTAPVEPPVSADPVPDQPTEPLVAPEPSPGPTSDDTQTAPGDSTPATTSGETTPGSGGTPPPVTDGKAR
jgi:hypothetical protein